MSTPPLIRLAAVAKTCGGEQPLRIDRLEVGATDRLTLSGLDAGGAEMFVHLVTGAALPDEGEVYIDGRSTRDITTDTEWLRSLDRFGLVSGRAVLFESLPVAASLVLPVTLRIDPIPSDVLRQVTGLAEEAGLPVERLDRPASALTPADRIRVHLVRALLPGPALLLLERPTAGFDGRQAAAFGETLRALADRRGFGWIALSDDDAFAGAAGGERRWLDAAGGMRRPRRWRIW